MTSLSYTLVSGFFAIRENEQSKIWVSFSESNTLVEILFKLLFEICSENLCRSSNLKFEEVLLKFSFDNEKLWLVS